MDTDSTDDERRTLTLPGWLDLKISLGNLLTIGTILAAGIISYARMDARVSATEGVIAKTEFIYVRKDVSDLREAALANRLDDLKTQLNRVEVKLDEYKAVR